MMEDRPDMRASDADRQEVVERLRGALDEGRLKMDEYLERMERAYEAVTYGDLVPLCRDLPEARPVAKPETAAPPSTAKAPRAEVVRRGGFAGLPTALKVLWMIWATAVSINVVVWVLVSATTAHLQYPWPLWVAGPWGVVLLGLTALVTTIRRDRRA
jgi:hypothetical protein